MSLLSSSSKGYNSLSKMNQDCLRFLLNGPEVSQTLLSSSLFVFFYLPYSLKYQNIVLASHAHEEEVIAGWMKHINLNIIPDALMEAGEIVGEKKIFFWESKKKTIFHQSEAVLQEVYESSTRLRSKIDLTLRHSWTVNRCLIRQRSMPYVLIDTLLFDLIYLLEWKSSARMY